MFFFILVNGQIAYLGKHYENCVKCGRKVEYKGEYSSEIPQVVCHECSHCDACGGLTNNKKNGLCGDCRTIMAQKAKEIFFNVLDGVSISKQQRNGVTFTIYFAKDIDSKLRVLERVDLADKQEKKGRWSLFKKNEVEKKPLTQPFHILSTMLKKTPISSNTVKIEVNLTFKQRFGSMISGGNYDYRQGIDEGYTVHVVAESDDSCTIPIITKILREELKFGCHVSNRTIDGFLPFVNPTPEGEEKLAQEVIKNVIAAFDPGQHRVL